MTDDKEREGHKSDIRKLLYQAAGMIPSTPALELKGYAAILKDASVAIAREAKRFDMEGMTDDDVWDRLRGEPVTLELLLAFLSDVFDAITILEKRIIALENPKQPWEQG